MKECDVLGKKCDFSLLHTFLYVYKSKAMFISVLQRMASDLTKKINWTSTVSIFIKMVKYGCLMHASLWHTSPKAF